MNTLVYYTSYIDALEKRIRRIEEKLQTPGLPEVATVSQIGSSNFNNMNHFQGKQPQGALTDRVLYLGDLSTLQFFSNKIPLDEKKTFTGRHIRRFGKQIVLVGDSKEDEEEQQQQQISPYIQPIYQYVYSVTGADRYTSDKLIKMYLANTIYSKRKICNTLLVTLQTYIPCFLWLTKQGF